METQKTVNLLNVSDNENSIFATKKCYIIDNESKCNYLHENPIKFLISSLESTFVIILIYFSNRKYYCYRW